MPAVQRYIAYGGSAALLALLAGLVARGRYRCCPSFALYVVTVWASDLLILLWPGRFYRWDFWLLKEAVHTALKMAVALEIAARTFRAFPGARATARGVVLLVLLFTLGTALGVPRASTDYGILAGDVIPRVLNGTAWLFVGIAGVILWYRLPVHWFHKAIVMGFAPYLLVFTVAMNALRVYGWKADALSGYVHSGAYLAPELFWAFSAWRRAPVAKSEAGESGLRILARGPKRRSADGKEG